MQKLDNAVLFSASDLVHFLSCRHHTALDLMHLQSPLPLSATSSDAELFQEKGVEHEQAYLAYLQKAGRQVVEIPTSGSLMARVETTRQAIGSGVNVIYQAVLAKNAWIGYVDFLCRVETPSKLGGYSYEVLDTKLSKTPTAKHVLQLCVYSDLLGVNQGVAPHMMGLVLGDMREVRFRVADYMYYYASVLRCFGNFTLQGGDSVDPEPCAHCDLCRWKDRCTTQWEHDDHLSLVANIQRSHIHRLQEAGITTTRALADMPRDQRVVKIGTEIMARLQHQASLQIRKRDTGEDQVEILPLQEGRGFDRLPLPHPGDLFFDIEGDPLYPDGLEYLFGLWGFQEKEPELKMLWGHDHVQERQMFETLMDLFADHLRQNPEAYIYHYNHYEPTALKRLASRYGSREAILDDLLRRQKFVDLYKVVREGILVSEPRYSLKHLERFFSGTRTGDVTTASQSIVFYEQWQKTGDQNLLDQIEAYNAEDCRSTKSLRDWLIGLRPETATWHAPAGVNQEEGTSDAMLESEARQQDYARRLLDHASDAEHPLRELVAQLLDFHRREAKPAWWAMFDRQTREEAELIDDTECLGGLRADPTHPPVREKQSMVTTYRFPPQEYKFTVGNSCLIARTLERAGAIVELTPDQGVIRLKRGVKQEALPESLSIIPTGPIKTDVMRDAIYRFADAVIDESQQYQAVRDLLCRLPPRIAGYEDGAPVIRNTSDLLTGAIQAVSKLQESYLLIQGPPGSGKTYTSSHILVELIRQGHTVGVASNSHKAINNLLRAVEKQAIHSGVTFRGIKKCTAGQTETYLNGSMITDVTDNKAIDLSANLIAGTAWLFARPELDQSLDYLFIDEAGQVSLANLVAMGLSARNIVLVGDHMQLGQPIQGVHPGDSGQSVLEFLLHDQATIPEDRGIFLPSTWRMHQDVCGFISEAVYDGRLVPEPANQNQRILLAENAHPVLASSGIRFVPVEHNGCSQKSEKEGEVLREIYVSLLAQRYCDRNSREHPMTMKDILVVTPYNVQVNYLKSILPEGARVGTVDKFQGQEAVAVLISMVTSSSEELPRTIEFLYSQNRLNVAVSRARCLAVMVASPRLLEIQCQNVEHMKLVNMLCWIRAYAERQTVIHQV